MRPVQVYNRETRERYAWVDTVVANNGPINDVYLICVTYDGEIVAARPMGVQVAPSDRRRLVPRNQVQVRVNR